MRSESRLPIPGEPARLKAVATAGVRRGRIVRAGRPPECRNPPEDLLPHRPGLRWHAGRNGGGGRAPVALPTGERKRAALQRLRPGTRLRHATAADRVLGNGPPHAGPPCPARWPPSGAIRRAAHFRVGVGQDHGGGCAQLQRDVLARDESSRHPAEPPPGAGEHRQAHVGRQRRRPRAERRPHRRRPRGQIRPSRGLPERQRRHRRGGNGPERDGSAPAITGAPSRTARRRGEANSAAPSAARPGTRRAASVQRNTSTARPPSPARPPDHRLPAPGCDGPGPLLSPVPAPPADVPERVGSPVPGPRRRFVAPAAHGPLSPGSGEYYRHDRRAPSRGRGGHGGLGAADGSGPSRPERTRRPAPDRTAPTRAGPSPIPWSDGAASAAPALAARAEHDAGPPRGGPPP